MTLFKRLPESWQYVLLGVVLWIVVDWGTAGGFRIASFPLWFVHGELGRHRRLIAGLVFVELIIMTLTTIGNPGP